MLTIYNTANELKRLSLLHCIRKELKHLVRYRAQSKNPLLVSVSEDGILITKQKCKQGKRVKTYIEKLENVGGIS